MSRQPPIQPDSDTQESALVRIYFGSQRLLGRFTLLLGSWFTGFWLGVLTRKQLHSIAERHYRKQDFYWTDEWNKSGLLPWEKRALERSFAGCKKLLVAGVGGGREVIALRQLGIEVDGFDSHPGLVRFANELVEREGMVPNIQWAPWDHCPDLVGRYDGIIVGWGAYMHIRRRERRVEFLHELRDKVDAGSPILLSFYVTGEHSRYFRWVARIGRPLAWILHRDPVHVGDGLTPHFSHYFTKARLESELVEGGFELVSFETVEYGHALGRAV